MAISFCSGELFTLAVNGETEQVRILKTAEKIQKEVQDRRKLRS